MESISARQSMIWGQVQPNKVTADPVLDALASVPREVFVPKAYRGCAYLDEAIPFESGRALMAPMVLARLIQAADIQPTDLVLEVGCGSGYEAAVLGKMADAVIALEEDDSLAGIATGHLQTAGAENVAVVAGKLTEGVPGQGPYQVIFINGAVDYVRDALINQLADGGRLVCVRNEAARHGGGIGRGHLIVKSGEGLVSHDLFDAAAPTLDGFCVKHGFEF